MSSAPSVSADSFASREIRSSTFSASGKYAMGAAEAQRITDEIFRQALADGRRHTGSSYAEYRSRTRAGNESLADSYDGHVFRRSCGTWLGATDGGGMDLPNVAAWLGHSDATVTLRHYMKPGTLEAPATLDALVSAEGRG